MRAKEKREGRKHRSESTGRNNEHTCVKNSTKLQNNEATCTEEGHDLHCVVDTDGIMLVWCR